MKRLLACVLAAALSLSLCACGEPSPEEIAAENYQQAVDFLNAGSLAEALPILRELGDYQDAPALRKSAAYTMAVDYIKENGTAITLLEGSETGTFPYGILEQDNEAAFQYLAVDENDQLVFGTGADASDDSVGTIILVWSYWMTLSETSQRADIDYWEELMFSYNGISGGELQQGSDSVDITTYTDDTAIEMDITSYIIDVYGNEKTSEKALTSMFNSEGLAAINHVPFTAETMLAETGVTLGDLGFTALDQPTAAEETETTETEGGQQEEPQEETSAPSASQPQGDGIFLTSVDGTADLEYKGWEYAPEGVFDNTVDTSKVIFVLMDYTNRSEDEPRQMQDDFWYRVFQNGVELDSDFTSYYSGVYKPLEDFYKEVMMGGTVTVARFFLLEDNSPITIVAHEQSSPDNKQSMTVELN